MPYKKYKIRLDYKLPMIDNYYHNVILCKQPAYERYSNDKGSN